MANLACTNPAYGVHLIVRGDLREETLKSILQRVMKWAEDDRDMIEYHHGGRVAFVRIPPEVLAEKNTEGELVPRHAELVMRKGADPVDGTSKDNLAVDRAVWVEPTIFDVDGVNPNTLIEYDQVIEPLEPRGEPTHDTITLRFTYDGTLEEKTEPQGWILRWRKKPGKGDCPDPWNIWDLAGWERVVTFRGLTPETTYEFTVQGIAQPGSTSVLTPSTKPVEVTTKEKPWPGEDPTKPNVPEKTPEEPPNQPAPEEAKDEAKKAAPARASGASGGK